MIMEKAIIFITLQLTFSFCLIAQNVEQIATRFGVKAPYDIFVGGILKANDINNGKHQFLNIRMNPITISYSLLLKSEVIVPSYSNMIDAIQKKLQESNVLKPSYQFSFTIKQLDSFEQLSSAFGETIDISAYFGITNPSIFCKTALVLDISQSYFSLSMDIPEVLSDDPLVKDQINELLYVNSIEFGKRAILIVESNFSYQELKNALTEILSTSNNKNTISEKTKSLIANSTIRALILDPQEIQNITPDNPLEYLLKYMNAEVNSENFGVPIFFNAAWLKDNSVYVNKFP